MLFFLLIMYKSHEIVNVITSQGLCLFQGSMESITKSFHYINSVTLLSSKIRNEIRIGNYPWKWIKSWCSKFFAFPLLVFKKNYVGRQIKVGPFISTSSIYIFQNFKLGFNFENKFVKLFILLMKIHKIYNNIKTVLVSWSHKEWFVFIFFLKLLP